MITDLGRINLAKFLPLYNICQSLVQQGELVKTERMCVTLPDLRNVSEKTIFINLANELTFLESKVFRWRSLRVLKFLRRRDKRRFELRSDSSTSKPNQCFFLNLIYTSFKTTVSF